MAKAKKEQSLARGSENNATIGKTFEGRLSVDSLPFAF
jgi:hypothetical protein